MMAAHCSAVLTVYPPFRQYSDSTNFTSFHCVDTVDYNSLSNEDIEWLYSNFTVMTTTSRICGITNV